MNPKCRAQRNFSIVVCIAIACGCAAVRKGPQPADAKKLPDPLRFNDGKRVKTADAWNTRRAEIIDMVLSIEYGRVPPSPGNVVVKSEAAPEIVNDG